MPPPCSKYHSHQPLPISQIPKTHHHLPRSSMIQMRFFLLVFFFSLGLAMVKDRVLPGSGMSGPRSLTKGVRSVATWDAGHHHQPSPPAAVQTCFIFHPSLSTLRRALGVVSRIFRNILPSTVEILQCETLSIRLLWPCVPHESTSHFHWALLGHRQGLAN